MTVVRTRTPSGEAIVILPAAEFERLVTLAEDVTAMERGARVGDIGDYRACAEALGVELDDLLPDADAA